MTELLLPLTLAAYGAAVLLRRRVSSPLLNPTLVAMIAIGAVLLATGTPYGRYSSAARPLSALLTPAVVALAVPLYRHRDILRRHARPLLIAAFSGAAAASAVGYAGSLLLHLGPAWSLAATSRSATSPIAIALAGRLGGRASLSAVLSITTGVVGATLGPTWLDRLRIHHPLARGLAHGVASHGIGTARMVEDGHLPGAASAVGMALGGTMIALGLPLLWH